MDSSKVPSYLLQELPDITKSIQFPLKDSQRIKYTCFDVSRTLIAFGATSGGIYIFNRNPCEFMQLIPNKDGAITRLVISSDENHIGYGNGRGTVAVTECKQPLTGSHSVVTSKEHQGNEVTSMVWSRNNVLICGDDVGRVSVLQLQSFIAKTMFQDSSQIIMRLDSRICQLDVKDNMLLVSTLTRCYICDMHQEQYRQIGQKLRDGEFGACFVTKDHDKTNLQSTQNFSEVKQYHIVDNEETFALNNIDDALIFCARPSSRLWEATLDGIVKRTHQFKQFLNKNPMNVMTIECYNNENYCIENDKESCDQSVNFPKLYSLKSAIFSFKRDALFFLNVTNVEDTIWFDSYKDIVECKTIDNTIYLWLKNGTLVVVRFVKVEKFLMKCFLDGKFILCGELCALFCEYLLSNNLSGYLHVLVGLREKLPMAILEKINDVLEKFESLKVNEMNQMKTGIHVVDNAYYSQFSLDDTASGANYNESTLNNLPPEAMQTLKDISHSVTDKLNSSKKILKEKWGDFEGRMKHLGHEKQIHETTPIRRKEIFDVRTIENRNVPSLLDTDIIYKESSHKAIEVDDGRTERNKLCKSLYQYYRLKIVGKESEESNLISILENNSCDIRQIYDIMLSLEDYCVSIEAIDESKLVPSTVFLSYLCVTSEKENMLDTIIKDEALYKYFVDSCITVNIKTQKLSNIGCECGYPLPVRTTKVPVFSELIDEFIEKQWQSSTRDQCYEMCKKMPFLWRKILYLRRNEDLLNVLRILLQMLDEKLLHNFLPQFTLDTWDRAIQLYATLHANVCLNCSKKFHHISVKETLSWDDLGLLLIKSMGSRKALQVMEKHADLISAEELSMKFYHTCLLVALYSKYDATINNQLADALYASYEFEEARKEIFQLVRFSIGGVIKNTALPLSVANKSNHWGLKLVQQNSGENDIKEDDDIQTLIFDEDKDVNNLNELSNTTDCTLCGLPFKNEVLVKDGGLWVFKCGHTFHGACLDLNKIKLCPECSVKV